MQRTCGLIALILACGSIADAEPIDDARAIVDLTVTRDQYESVFAGMADLMLGNLQNEFRGNGQEISEDAAQVAVEMMTQKLVDGMMEYSRDPIAEIYALYYSPKALNDYRAFLETDSGKEIIAKLPAVTAEGTKMGSMIGGQIASNIMESVVEDMRADKWPEGTLMSTKAELRILFDVLPVSEMPAER